MIFDVYLPVAGVAANALLLSGTGAAVGFMSGMFGVGGGFLITPLLIFLGIPTEVAIATGANQAVATSVAGATGQWQRNNVDVKMGLVLVSSGLLGSYLGIELVAILRRIGQFELFVGLSYVVLLGTVGILMLVESASTIREAHKSGAYVSPRASKHSWVHGLPLKMRFHRSRLYISAIPPLMVGGFTGVLTAVMGVGGGFILVPAMVYLLNMRTSLAIGTSLFQIVFVSAFTTLLQAVTLKSVDVLLASILIISGVVGTQIGVRVGATLKGEHLRALLALVILMVSVRVAVDLVRQPDDPYVLSPVGANQ